MSKIKVVREIDLRDLFFVSVSMAQKEANDFKSWGEILGSSFGRCPANRLLTRDAVATHFNRQGGWTCPSQDRQFGAIAPSRQFILFLLKRRT